MFCLTWLAHYLVTVPYMVVYGWLERFGAEGAGGRVLYGPASSKVNGTCTPHPLFLRLMTGINRVVNVTTVPSHKASVNTNVRYLLPTYFFCLLKIVTSLQVGKL